MSFFEKRYYIKGWKGNRYYLTAKQLYERVSKSDCNLIASATELVRICNKPNFPKEYSEGIKIAILNCFAKLETKKGKGFNLELTDKDAVYSCYNSLDGTDEKIIKAKEKYLDAIIKAVTLFFYKVPIHVGPEYSRVCNEWRKEKFDEYSSKKEIDFKSLIPKLKSDFEKTIKSAEEDGIFLEEDEAHWGRMRREVRCYLNNK